MLGATRRPGATLVGPRPPSHGSTAERAPTRPVGTHATAMDAAAALPALPRGHTPNTRWLAPTWDELRASGTIDGLPPRPPGWLPAGPTEYGLVRQDDAALTRAIHGGVLTGGRLNAVLGFAEGPLARRLKVPGSTGGAPGAARIAALLHIAQPLWAPADGLPGPRHTPSSFGRGGERKGGRRRGVGVSGGPRGAKTGKLAIWVGGDKEVFEKFKHVLGAMGDQARYVGPIGQATVAKLVHNCAGYAMNVALAEVFTMGVKAGVDPLVLFEAVRQGALGRRRTFDGLIDQFLPGTYDPPAFQLRHAHKDVSLAVALGKEVSVPMRACNLTLEEMTEALNRGWAERDSRSAMLLQQERAGVKIAVDADELAAVVKAGNG